MALDLFFVPKKLDPAVAQARDFKTSAAQQRARCTLLEAIGEQFAGAAIDAAAIDGPVSDFPLGELVAHPGYLHWSLHGRIENEPVQTVVDWFLEQGLICDDPQQAGFGNRERPQGRRASPTGTTCSARDWCRSSSACRASPACF